MVDRRPENGGYGYGRRYPSDYGGYYGRGYGRYVREFVRVLLSLRAVNTQLPVHILASGERYPQVESQLAQRFNVSFLDASALPPFTVPSWASKWARGSFAKLRALALTQFKKLIVPSLASRAEK